MKKILYLLILICFYAESAIITSGVTMSPGNVPTVNYFSTSTTNDSDGDLFAQGWRYFGVGVHNLSFVNGNPYPNPNYGTLFGINTYVSILPGDTWSVLSQKFIAKYGATGSMTPNWGLNTVYNYESCAMVSTCYNCGTTIKMYPGSCSSIPWTPIACNFGDTALLINHGTLNSEQVNGHSATVNTRVTCDAAATIRFRTTVQRIDMGNGIYSDIYINGQGFSSGVGDATLSVPTTGLPLTIESRLVSSNPQPGLFSGNTVIIMDVL